MYLNRENLQASLRNLDSNLNILKLFSRIMELILIVLGAFYLFFCFYLNSTIIIIDQLAIIIGQMNNHYEQMNKSLTDI